MTLIHPLFEFNERSLRVNILAKQFSTRLATFRPDASATGSTPGGGARPIGRLARSAVSVSLASNALTNPAGQLQIGSATEGVAFSSGSRLKVWLRELEFV